MAPKYFKNFEMLEIWDKVNHLLKIGYGMQILWHNLHKKFQSHSTSKTAKYCLRIQKGLPDTFTCNWCCKEFVSHKKLEEHKDLCVLRLQEELKERDDRLQKLEDEKNAEINKLKDELYTLKLKMARIEAGYDIYEKEYHAIRDKPTASNYNTITQNKLKLVNTSTIEPFTLDTVKKRLTDSGYTYDMFLQGSMGVKKFILGIITKDEEKSYVSTDSNRKNFHRLEMAKKWVDDKGALFLTKVFDEMRPLTLEYFGRFHEETSSCEEREENDKILDKIMPVVRAINHPEHKDRKTLQDEIVKYIKPYVSI